ncbi:tetratricopeptide repeat protein [Shimazuella sp. AN120528]|uniref:helix-turn-helix domain-containing protein n=1 Tax=Shimazuella soli TaxID=1892854 RepID=UPI001F0F2D60|nr:tetratricopeptide repeat protein [Shimazuella soli]MCH5585560.1 tetratricopeptide repeat protein [Shimazuella soli]
MEISDYFIGYLVRKTRQELGLNLKNLSAIASISTLSKFERGQCTLGKEKLEHLFSILNIQTQDIPSMLKKLKQDQAIQDLVFHAIESMIRQNVYSLARFKEAANYLHSQTTIIYLKGKYYLQRGKLEKASQHYKEVINAKDHDYIDMHLNILASAYLDLSMIADKENNFNLALEYSEEGNTAFHPNGKRKYVEDDLIYNKALFLLKLGRIKESNLIIEQIWNNRLEIESVSTKARVYKLMAVLLKYQGRYDEATNILEEAIEIATTNSLIDIGFELWIELGDIAYIRDLYDFSEKAYEIALLSKNNLESKTIITEAHISLARLYAKIGLYKKAETEIQRAINIAEQHKDMYKLTKALLLQGKILIENNLEKAMLVYYRTWELSKTYDLKRLEHKVLYHLIKHEKNKETQQELLLRRLELELLMNNNGSV